MGKSILSPGRISATRLQPVMVALVLMAVLVPGMVGAQTAAPSAYGFQVLYEFCTLQNCADGGAPWAGLIEDSAANLYGTTAGGFDYNGDGVVFKLNKHGKETVLHGFTGAPSDGSRPIGAGLVRDPAGNLYGTTELGGTSNWGTVFRVDAGGNETLLYSFQGGTDGGNPEAGLVRDSAGNLYGTTYQGGDLNCGFEFGCGTVFKLDTSGNETVLHAFTFGSDSGFPMGGLVMDKKGNLYGTTYGNGTDTPGTVYKVTPSGKETVLYTFKNGKDGDAPIGNLIMDAKGNLYGTTSSLDYIGGFFGTVFKLSKTGKETVLWDFRGYPDGATPNAGVVMDKAGNLYGTTQYGGDINPPNCQQTGGCGTVFKLSKGGRESVLYRFQAGSDGGFPQAGLLLDAKASLYGTARGYGAWGGGVVFKITPR